MALIIRRVCPNDMPDELLNQWADLYCSIWKEPPWNEDFWKPEEVILDIRRELNLPNARAFLALADGSVVGFSWGYSVDSKAMQKIADNDKLNFLFTDNSTVFYIDELGVNVKYRGQGIGKSLSRSLLDSITVDKIASKVILRTDEKAMSARHVYTVLGFQELLTHDGKYPDRNYWTLML